MGTYPAAEEHFRDAHVLDGKDSYLLAAFADFLLDRSRPSEALSLVKDFENVDGLLLRRARARKAMKSDIAGLQRDTRALASRFEASRLRGDTAHQREEARFLFSILEKSHLALGVAEANWNVQREPADARLVLETAVACHNPAAARDVLAWMDSTKIEDVCLTALAHQLK